MEKLKAKENNKKVNENNTKIRCASCRFERDIIFFNKKSNGERFKICNKCRNYSRKYYNNRKNILKKAKEIVDLNKPDAILDEASKILEKNNKKLIIYDPESELLQMWKDNDEPIEFILK